MGRSLLQRTAAPESPYLGSSTRNAAALQLTTTSENRSLTKSAATKLPRPPRVQLPWHAGEAGVLSETLHIREIPHVWGSRIAPEMTAAFPLFDLMTKLALPGGLSIRNLSRGMLFRRASLMSKVSFYASVLASAYVVSFMFVGAALIIFG